MKLYLTDEDYEIAVKNGINRKLAYDRFYNRGWDAEDAISKPKGNQGILKKIQKEALENGIELNIGAIANRRRLRWSHEKIVTTPLHGTRNTNKEYLKRAIENGISQDTFYGRLRLGWSRERACTDPVNMEFSKNKKLG